MATLVAIGLTAWGIASVRLFGGTHATARAIDQSRLANLKVEIGTMIRAVEANLDAAAPQLDRESVEELREALAAAQQARESDELEAVQRARDELERASMPLAAATVPA